MLIDRNYLEESVWKDRCPTYYIEVKTTMLFLDTDFYCSQRQFDRMEGMQLTGIEPSDEIYLIARVFQLGCPKMGLRLLLDPASLRRTGDLDFKADKYAVTIMDT